MRVPSAIEALQPCREAVSWIEGFRPRGTEEEAWDACPRGDWMLWLLGKLCHTDQEHKKLVLASCACARLALHHVRHGEHRPRIAIETAEAWARGTMTLDQVRAAASAATAASAASSATSAAAAAAECKMLQHCADEVRKFYPEVPNIKKTT